MNLASLAICLFSLAPGDDPEPSAPDRAYLAPVNRWYTHGGSASRSGGSATTPLRGPVEIAWTHNAGGAIEGEPLVWDERVIITVRTQNDKRIVRVLDLLTGEALLRDYRVESELPLEPTVWRNTLVIRKDPTTLAGLRIDPKQLRGFWKSRGKHELGPPLLVGSELYVVRGDALERLTPGKKKPIWRLEGNFRGRVSMRGSQVFAVEYDRLGQAFLVALNRKDGTPEDRQFLGHHGGRTPAQGEGVVVQLLPSGNFVHFETELQFVGTKEFTR